MRHHRQPMVAHPFQPDPSAPDWRADLSCCARCGLGKANRIHIEYVPPEDNSGRILGEHDEEAAA